MSVVTKNMDAYLRCRLELTQGLAFDSIGWQSRQGLAEVCVGCPHAAECESMHSIPDVGLADGGVRLHQGFDGIEAHWNCPSCGNSVTEGITALAALRLAETILADPLCFSCRRRAA